MNRFLTIFLILSLFAACNSDDYDPYVWVEPNSIVVPAAGGDYRIIVGAALSWTMSGNAEWCTPSATSGPTGEEITLRIVPNTSGKERSVTYTFTCGDQPATLTVTQEAGSSTIFVAPSSIAAPAEGDSQSVTVSSSGPWTMSGNAEWCTPSATSGQDGEAIAFEIAANTSGKERSVTYTFTCGKQTATLTVTQSGKTGSVDFGDYEEENWN